MALSFLAVQLVGLTGVIARDFLKANASNAEDLVVTVDASKVLAKTDSLYVGYNLDTDWLHNNYSNPALQILTARIGPTHVRVGGTFADYQIYDVGADKSKYSCKSLPKPMTDYRCTMVPESTFESLFAFASINKVKLILGLNNMFGRPPKIESEGNICNKSSCPEWDPSNTKAFLQWVHLKGYPVYAFELGNELNKVLKGKAGATAQAMDLATLKQLVANIWGTSTSKPLIFGPDTHSWIMFNDHDLPDEPQNWQAMLWFQELVKQACDHVDGFTYHMYLGGQHTANVSNFTSADFLHRSYVGGEKILEVVQKQCPRLLGNIWAGETASANQGGLAGVSDKFADVFWYADQLGTLARLGHAGFQRQKLISGGTNYGLISLKDSVISPNPDYYVAILYKELMSNKVLAVSQSDASMQDVRVYAHCAADSDNKVSLVLLNLGSNTKSIKLAGDLIQEGFRHEWHLANTKSGLTGADVELNGKLLTFDQQIVPVIDGKPVPASSPLTLEPRSVTFITTPCSATSVCASSFII